MEATLDVGLAIRLVEPLYKDVALDTGESALEHADAMVSILREVKDDPELLAAAYLFMVPSIIQNSGDWIEKSFGESVNRLVQELNRVPRLSEVTRNDTTDEQSSNQAEVMRKMLIAMCNDLRVVLLLSLIHI